VFHRGELHPRKVKILHFVLKTTYIGKETLENNYTEADGAVCSFSNNKPLDVKTPRPVVSLRQ